MELMRAGMLDSKHSPPRTCPVEYGLQHPVLLAGLSDPDAHLAQQVLPSHASNYTATDCQCEASHACRFQVAMHAFLAAVCSDVLACVWKLCAPAGMPAMQSPDHPSRSQDLYSLTQQVSAQNRLKIVKRYLNGSSIMYPVNKKLSVLW